MKNLKKFYLAHQNLFVLRSLSIRRIILSPPIMIQSKNFFNKTLTFMHNWLRKIQISKSKPKKFSRLCTFNVSCLFLSFSLIISGVKLILIKVDWLAACIALRVVGAVLVVFLLRWRKIYTILQPMSSKGWNLKKCLKPCWLVKSSNTSNINKTMETCINRKKYTFCVIKSVGHLKKLKKLAASHI